MAPFKETFNSKEAMNQLGTTLKINIVCPSKQKIECEVDKKKESMIKSLEGSMLEMVLPAGLHHISLRQFHILNTKRWFLYICNPMRFLNYAFFKTEFTKHSAYNADAATVDFDVLLEDETRIINIIDLILWRVLIAFFLVNITKKTVCFFKDGNL